MDHVSCLSHPVDCLRDSSGKLSTSNDQIRQKVWSEVTQVCQCVRMYLSGRTPPMPIRSFLTSPCPSTFSPLGRTPTRCFCRCLALRLQLLSLRVLLQKQDGQEYCLNPFFRENLQRALCASDKTPWQVSHVSPLSLDCVATQLGKSAHECCISPSDSCCVLFSMCASSMDFISQKKKRLTRVCEARHALLRPPAS